MAEPEKLWTRDDFKEYVHKELNWSRIDLDDIPRDGHPIPDTDPFQWIFWGREQDDSDTPMLLLYDKWNFISNPLNSLTLKEKVRIAIRKLLYSPYDGNILVQFWTFTTTSDGRTLLTTQGQPFGLTQLSNPLCEYRMICKDYTFYVDGRNGEEELGIPGRVYLNKCPECTPDVEYYSVKEYPQRNRTLRCGVRQSLHLPVIKDQTCVGVLELVGSFELGDISDSLYAAFQGLDLVPSLEPLQNRGERMQVDSSDQQLIDAEQCEVDVNHPQEIGTRKTSGRKHKNSGVRIKIPYEDIMHYSKLSRCDAAKNLQVSITTLQRACREYGISRWPPRNVDKVRPPQPSHVDVKAKYVEDLTIMFPLSLSSTLEDLYDCIESGLHLSCATYHAWYKDGDNDKITITCDQGLQLWLRNSPRSPGSNAVILNIDPISQVHHTKSATPVSYIDCFPASLRPYILHVKDVALDGNCGFRAIAGLIGIGEDGWVQVRRDLLTELNSHVDEYKIMYGGQQRINELIHCLSWFDGFPGMDRWMTLPDMGHLIASCYNVVLYLLSHQQCLTFLPLRSVPIPATSRREMTIGFVNNNHFVEVFLLPGHPVPPVASSWTQYRYQCAQGWDTAYNRRIQHFRELVGYNVATTDAISLD